MALLCLLLDAVCCGRPCGSEQRETLSPVLAGDEYSLGLERGARFCQGSSLKRASIPGKPHLSSQFVALLGLSSR